jgi:molybdopterin-containing oxidoreductase family iron-sulfur binding subunit
VNPAWDEVGRLVLNPDVVVRSRGVIEKCSLCVQQIQAGKLAAKKAGTPGEGLASIQTACRAGLPHQLPSSSATSRRQGRKVPALRESERAYLMIEEVGTQPNVNYTVKVRNTDTMAIEAHQEHREEAAAENAHD